MSKGSEQSRAKYVAHMGDRSAIEWTEATWNPVTGCSKVSPGCAHCYAETLSQRFRWTKEPWTPQHADVNVRLRPERLEQPLRWRTPKVIREQHERPVPRERALRVRERRLR